MDINAKNLDDAMEFDHVIQVNADGSVTTSIDGFWAPECHVDSDLPFGEPGSATHPYVDPPWVLMGGYSGQYGYSGPIMHSSEFIGGKLADDILAEPGLYVAVVIDDGWAVARRDV